MSKLARHILLTVLALMGSLLLAHGAQAADEQGMLLDFIARETSTALGTSVGIVSKRDLPALNLPADSELALRFSSRHGQYLPSGIEARSGGRLIRSVALGSYLDFQLSAAVLPGGLMRGEVVLSTSLKLETLTLAPGQEVVSDPALAWGLMARGAIAPGERLKLSRLVQPPLVRRGEAVALLVNAGGVQLSAQGEALADGYAGQSIGVKRASDGRVWRGVVETGISGTVVVVK